MKNTALLTCTIISLMLIFNSSCKKTQTSSLQTIALKTNWEFRQAGKNEWMPATVPGCVHTDLLSNNKIPDPFYRFNEKKLQWIENEAWEYRTKFDVSKNLLEKDIVEIDFKGLDTYADVFINDSLALTANNMFISWQKNIKDYLQPGQNTLRIYFYSPVEEGMKKLKALGYIPFATNEQAPPDQRTNVFTRKAPFHYGWDWGPRLVTSGIWQPVYLKAWNAAKIDDVFLKQKQVSENFASYSAITNVIAARSCKADIAIVVNGNMIAKKKAVSLDTGINSVAIDFEIKNPTLWWPNGMGEPNLYDVSVQLMQKGKILNKLDEKLGVRTLEIRQIPDSIGKSFEVVVNGIPVFMKGANSIPLDIFTTRVDSQQYQRLIDDALDANMNMLRVWGGAIYENTIFYDLCDENGILVWQDFMFACAVQPDIKEHLENIRKEAEYNVKRLRNHACIALWCGNNENLMAWHEWGWKNKYPEEIRKRAWANYEKIFYEILPQAVKENDPNKFYWASSPQSGNNELANTTSGDLHDWSIWFGDKPFEGYKQTAGRFMSEYGIQAFPIIKTLESVAKPKDLGIHTKWMNYRQRSNLDWIAEGMNGNGMIERYVKRYFKKPDDFETFVYVSQLMQAKALRMATETHRRNKPVCMGTLYWQINDCWPTVSWATVDYYGRWKAAHYHLVKTYAPVLVSTVVNQQQLSVYIINDKRENSNGQLELRLMDFSGKELWKKQIQANVNANSSRSFFDIPEKELTKKGNKNKMLLVACFKNENNKILSRNLFYFQQPKDLILPEAKFTHKITKKNQAFEITIKAQSFIKNLYLKTGENGKFTDNFFDMLPGEEVTIQFIPKNKNINQIQLSTISLSDTF